MSLTERLLVFDRDFLDDLAFWVSTDRKVALKILELVEAIRRDPFAGLGKPEPLRNLGRGVLVASNHPGTPPRLQGGRK